MNRFLFVGLLLLLPGWPGVAQRRPANEPAHTVADVAHLLPAIAALPDSGRVDQLLEFMDVMVEAGRLEEAAAAVREAMPVARASGQGRLVGRVEVSQGYLAAYLADFAEALRHYQRALDQARADHDYPRQAKTLTRIAGLSYQTKDWKQAAKALQQALALAQAHHLTTQEAGIYGELANLAGMQNRHAESLAYGAKAMAMDRANHDTLGYYMSLLNQGIRYKNLGQYRRSAQSYQRVIAYAQHTHDALLLGYAQLNLPRTLLLLHEPAAAERSALSALAWAKETRDLIALHEACDVLAAIKEQQGQYQAALAYQRQATRLQDSLFNQQKNQQLLTTDARYQTKARQARIGQLAADNTRQQRQLGALAGGFVLIGGLAFVLGRSNRQRRLANALLAVQKAEVQLQRDQTTQALTELRATQAQLIQQEKMASLGELTAGVAHEIQNPLNFVNNFAEVSTELVEELQEALAVSDMTEATALAGHVARNLTKITEHGKRAAGIVRGMLEHSRTSSGERQSTDLNTLCQEYLRLAYQGLRAKDKTFNAALETAFAPDLPWVDVVAGDLGRVLLNLFSNAFYAVQQRQQAEEPGYQPTVSVSTQRDGQQVEIRVSDNGEGMSEAVQAKIFQPFFTTKPTGKGTGLGLSLSYDIVTQGHGGTLSVESRPGPGTTLLVTVPL